MLSASIASQFALLLSLGMGAVFMPLTLRKRHGARIEEHAASGEPIAVAA